MLNGVKCHRKFTSPMKLLNSDIIWTSQLKLFYLELYEDNNSLIRSIKMNSIETKGEKGHNRSTAECPDSHSEAYKVGHFITL